tara:strand:- start:1049 stop:1627 length:579 start_codon:yes stop_codon:yes gene_type:complete
VGRGLSAIAAQVKAHCDGGAGVANVAQLAHRRALRVAGDGRSPGTNAFRRQPEGRIAWGGRQRSANNEGKTMALYEHVFLARQDLAQAQVDALAETATKIIEDNEGKVVKTETWGLRSLAYKIAKNRKAHFVMLEIDAPGGVVAELERQTQINEDVIRFMTIRVDEHENGPSVMMRKGERDGRRSRRDRDND